LSRHKILIVADRKPIGASLQQILKRNKFAALLVPNARLALRAIRDDDPDAIILDMASPRWSGWVVARSLRRITEAPLIAVSAAESPLKNSHELDASLSTPVSSRKLLKTIRTLLARPRFIQAGDLILDMKSREVTVGDRSARLPPKEFALLKSLMTNAGTVLSRKTIMRLVWNTDFMDDTRTLDVHIRWLRERIEEDPSNPTFVRTIRGVGYQFVSPDGNVSMM